MDKQGVIVGCDSYQEWLLPWWWGHYSAHNSYPVAFADFGMSKEAIAWCKERGQILPQASKGLVIKDAQVTPERKISWETRCGVGVWKSRPIWFKKPFALQQTPFTSTLWLDADCRVRGPLQPIFDYLTPGVDIAICKELEEVQESVRKLGFLLPGEANYNSAVIAYRKGAKVIDEWVELSKNHNDAFMGDQEALSRAIFLQKPNLAELSPLCNWTVAWGNNEEALVWHYLGGFLKMVILQDILQDFQRN